MIEIGFAYHDGDVAVLKVGEILLQEPGRSILHLARLVIDPALIRFAQLAEPCQKRGKVGSVKQRLLAELDALEVTPFDRCVQCSATDAEQLKCLVDRVRNLRKTEGRRVDRINFVLLSLSTLDAALFVETCS